MQHFAQLLAQFEDRLKNTLPFPAAPDTLYEPCRYFLNIGGKRLRPVLCLMGNELFADLNNDAWHAATGIELFHNFTLIHDDIMDRSAMRRGQPTVHERNGMTAGILCGDVMSIYAYDQLAHIKHCLPQVLHLFNKTSIEVCEGQQLDMDYEQRTGVTIENYVEMITLKTAVLIACALKMGALLGGTTEGNADKLYQFGKNLGIAFQLQDDFLDAFGTMEKIGKVVGGDIKSNKKTFLLLKAFENGNDAQKQALQTLLDGDNAGKVEAVLDIFKQTGADKACVEMMQHYSEKAFQCLDDVAVLSKRKQPLMEVANMLLNRDH